MEAKRDRERTFFVALRQIMQLQQINPLIDGAALCSVERDMKLMFEFNDPQSPV